MRMRVKEVVGSHRTPSRKPTVGGYTICDNIKVQRVCRRLSFRNLDIIRDTPPTVSPHICTELMLHYFSRTF